MDEFTEQIKLWRECLAGDDPNSVFRQIYKMTWDAAIFRLLLEGRRIQIERNPTTPSLNSQLHSFIDRNFFQSQAAGIRRLVDPGVRSILTGNKGVYSLPALIADMQANRAKFTRDSFLKNLGLPYDHSDIQKREQAFILEQVTSGNLSGFQIPSELDWQKSEEAHQTFDKLSCKAARERRPQDVIDDKIFVRLQEKLNACQEVTRFVDKYIAHAATPRSRIADGVDASKVTWGHISRAHKIIYEVAEYLGKVLLATDHVPLAIEQPGLLDHLDAPLVDTEDIPRLAEAWEQYRAETEQWRLDGVRQLELWVES